MSCLWIINLKILKCWFYFVSSYNQIFFFLLELKQSFFHTKCLSSNMATAFNWMLESMTGIQIHECSLAGRSSKSLIWWDRRMGHKNNKRLAMLHLLKTSYRKENNFSSKQFQILSKLESGYNGDMLSISTFGLIRILQR